MKVYEHQVQMSQILPSFWMVVYDKTIFFYRANYGHLRQLRLVSIRPALNQTQSCSAVRSHLFELINYIIYLN